MYLIGVSHNNADNGTTVAIIKKFLKNVKNHYQPVKIIKAGLPINSEQTKSLITNLYGDKNYIIRKKLFSQDRRPARIVFENPRLVVNCSKDGIYLADALRLMNIPVEGILIKNNESWEKHPQGKNMGDNYKVALNHLIRNFINVYKQKRLIAAEDRTLNEPVFSQIDSFVKKIEPNKTLNKRILDFFYRNDVIMSLSMPIWFRENIRYSRYYNA
jgi:hypothetical protein